MTSAKTPREIRVLSSSVVNKIAAGEVIERPASVVKELMENSVDAGATRIDVTIGKGGVELIRVTDDGCGMREDQLPLAVTSHATSKIESADDLFQVRSLGFRGEALASIAEVSHFHMKSRTQEQSAGHELEVIGGEMQPIAPCGTPVGTTIEVRNLFFNTPVRRRYLRTPQTESSHITEAFTRIALAYPEVHFRLSHNGRTIHDLAPVDNWKDRIGHFFGVEIRDALIPVSSQDGDVKLSGYVVDPTQSRAHNRMQYLFLNGRTIRDRALQHALSEGYRGLLLTGRFPIAFLRMELPPELVDVNVHPCKMEVRLQEGGRLYSQLLSAIRHQFLSTDLTAHVSRVTDEEHAERTNSSAVPNAPIPGPHLNPHSRRDEIKAWAEGASANAMARGGPVNPAVPEFRKFGTDLPERRGWERVGEGNEARSSSAGPSQRPLDLPSAPAAEHSAAGWALAERVHHRATGESPSARLEGEPANPDNEASPPPASTAPFESRRLTAIQVQNRYLVTEDEFGMVVIDQHALHERVLYEELREKVLAGRIETQRLLVPEPVSLSPAESAAVLEHREILRQIGIEVEPFGGDSILITSYPAMLAKRSPAEMLRNLVEDLLVDGKVPEQRDVIDEILHLISCKAAVKAGDRLSAEEITALLEHRELCQDAHHCPHGRPTALVFSREELDRRFKRI